MAVKNLKIIHCVFIAFTLVVISTPAKASLAQVVQLIVNFMTTNIAGFSGNIQQNSAGAQSQANALEMSTEVLGGVIADQTKTLGKLEYELQYGDFGRLGHIRINGVAPGGCFGKKRESNFKEYAKLVDETNETVFPEVNDYASPVFNYDRDEDLAERKAILDKMEETNFPLDGIFIGDNITLEQREVWADFVRHMTIPSPVVISKMGPPGSVDDQMVSAFRFKVMAGQVQKALLAQSDKYVKTDGNDSRMDVLKQYQAYAASYKRTRATNLKTEAGVQRELAEAQSMLLDIEAEIMDVNKSITGLLGVLAVNATDEMADEL